MRILVICMIFLKCTINNVMKNERLNRRNETFLAGLFPIDTNRILNFSKMEIWCNIFETIFVDHNFQKRYTSAIQYFRQQERYEANHNKF